jgi:hypothetical protein
MLAKSLDGQGQEADSAGRKDLDEMSRKELENELRYANAVRIDKKATWELRKSDILNAKASKTVAEAHNDEAAVAEAREDIALTKDRAAKAEDEHRAAHDYHQEVAAQLAKDGYTEEEVSKTYAEADDAQEQKLEDEYGRDDYGEEIARAEAEEEAKEAAEKKAHEEAAKAAKSETEEEHTVEEATDEVSDAEAEAAKAEAKEKAQETESAAGGRSEAEDKTEIAAGTEVESGEEINVEGTVRDPNNQDAWWRSPHKTARDGVPWWGAPKRASTVKSAGTRASPLLSLPFVPRCLALSLVLLWPFATLSY